MLPEPIKLAKARGFAIFGSEYDANWIVIRGASGKPDEYDGLSTLNWVERGAWKSVQIPVATRPGTQFLKNPMNANGTFTVVSGQYRGSHALGVYSGEPALVQVGKLLGTRDNDKDMILDPSDKLWDDASGVHHHACSNPAYLAGCQGSKSEHLAVLLDVFRWLRTKRPQDKVSLGLVVA